MHSDYESHYRYVAKELAAMLCLGVVLGILISIAYVFSN
jgi:hypothetical protein